VADCRTTGTCGDDLFDLSKITELLPLFLAVFAAIIVAQLFAPLIGMLFGAKLGLAAGILGPLAAIPVAIIQAVLLPFNLQICTIDPTGVNPPAIKVRSFGSRSLDADMVDTLATVVLNAISGKCILDSFLPGRPRQAHLRPRPPNLPALQLTNSRRQPTRQHRKVTF
jgi:hypothetical protein